MNDQILSAKTWQRLAERISVDPIGALPGSGCLEDLRYYVQSRDEGICIYCKSTENLQCDHVIPVSHGGPATSNNVVLACGSCNAIKSNSFRIDFLTIAFNHLLYVGENIDWVDGIFLPLEDRDEKFQEIFELDCVNCECRFKYHRITDFCSDECEDEFYEKEDIESECLMCQSSFLSKEEEDFCCDRCEYRWNREFDYDE